MQYKTSKGLTKATKNRGMSSLQVSTVTESSNRRLLKFNKQVHKRYSPIQHLILESHLSGHNDRGFYAFRPPKSYKQKTEEDTPIKTSPIQILQQTLTVSKLPPMNLMFSFLQHLQSKFLKGRKSRGRIYSQQTGWYTPGVYKRFCKE